MINNHGSPSGVHHRAVGVGAAGAAAAGPIICSVSLASCWILQFHPKIAPETISEGLKFKIFLGEGPQTLRFRRLLRFLVGGLCAPCHCTTTISSLKYAKRSPPDQTNIASAGLHQTLGDRFLAVCHGSTLTCMCKLILYNYNHDLWEKNLFITNKKCRVEHLPGTLLACSALCCMNVLYE